MCYFGHRQLIFILGGKERKHNSSKETKQSRFLSARFALTVRSWKPGSVSYLTRKPWFLVQSLIPGFLIKALNEYRESRGMLPHNCKCPELCRTYSRCLIHICWIPKKWLTCHHWNVGISLCPFTVQLTSLFLYPSIFSSLELHKLLALWHHYYIVLEKVLLLEKQARSRRWGLWQSGLAWALEWDLGSTS